MYTICEMAMIWDTPLVQYEYTQILRLSPAFVQHFHQATISVEWDEIRNRTRAKYVAAAAKRKLSVKRTKS